MKLLLIAFLSLASTGMVIAQGPASVNVLPVLGEYPRNNIKYANLTSGSVFFQDEWVKSKLVSPGKVIYKDVTIKLNLEDDKIHFLDDNGKELLIKEPMAEIEFQANKKGKKYYFLNSNILPLARKGWNLLLVNDTITLLKSFNKTVVERKSYNSPIEYSIETTDNYHVVYNNQAFDVKKPADLVDVLPGKKTEIEASIKRLARGMSKEDQMIAVVTFMNMLL